MNCFASIWHRGCDLDLMGQIAERYDDRVGHAQWRVKFLCALLDSHRALKSREGEWREKEVEYLKRLEEARAELQRLEVP